MQLIRAVVMAFAMYSRVPMPQIKWEESSIRWVFAFFPLVGVSIGALMTLWGLLARWMDWNYLITALGWFLIPLLISGGIHLDGFCDTCDALGSHQPRERKLEILKDSHIGAFGVIGCVVYLIAQFVLWAVLAQSGLSLWKVACIPVLSRTQSGLAAVTMKNARGSGMLASVTGNTAKSVTAVLIFWSLLCLALGGWEIVVVSELTLLYYRHMSAKEFGGITGDLEGWFLQMTELACLLALALLAQIGWWPL